MNREPEPPPPSPEIPPRRLFLREPGWRVALKVGSERAFCYMMEPGKDYYHRLLDGEIFVYHDDERICLACAVRRGLLSYEARGLGGQPLSLLNLDSPTSSQFDVLPPSDLPEV